MTPVMSPSHLKASAAVLAIVLMAGTAAAQTPMDDPLDARDARRVNRMEKVVRELRSIVFQLRDTGKPVIVEPADTDARMAELATRLNDLEQTLTRVNGSLDTATHELDLAKRANADLQARVNALSDKVAALAPPPPPPQTIGADAQLPGPGASPADAFAKARQLMLGGDYDAAQGAFGDFVRAWPDDPKAPEAHYWLGKTLAVHGAFADAAGAYIAAIRGWPKTAWAPDAVVELARALTTLKKPADACSTLDEFARRYPKPPAAVAAHAATARVAAKCG
jgi:tol-pal system protein YbgF